MQVDNYQTVRFDGNSYKVPRRYAFRPVTVKGYVDRVAVVADGQVIAGHERCYARHQRVLDPLHFLVSLQRKPAAPDHAPVYRDWQLPLAFSALRADLEARLGKATGPPHYTRVRQLLAAHPAGRVAGAIARCRQRGYLEASANGADAERLAGDNWMSLSDVAAPIAAVPLPDPARFDRLLSHSRRGDDATALSRRSRDSTRRRNSARLAGAFSVRARLRSSLKYMSKHQCKPFSMPR